MNPTAAEYPTAHTSPATAHMLAPTAWNPEPLGASHGPIQGPQDKPADQPTVPSDKWGMIEFFAKRACEPAELEGEIALLFEKRKMLSRRLMDAAKRRDDDQARDSAQAWIQTEVKLAGLFEQYDKFQQERKSVLQNLGMSGRG